VSFADIWLTHESRDPLPDHWLAPAEAHRLARIGNPAARQASATAHLLLRLALARHLNSSPAEVPLIRHCRRCDSRNHGPPLAPGTGLSVSIAHAQALVLVAISDADAVGVDVELCPPPGTFISAPTLQLTLSAAEQHRLTQLAEPDRARVFMRWWTRKESLFKATGDGLPPSPADLDLFLLDDVPFTIRWPNRELSPPYWVTDLHLNDAHALAAVCLTSAPTRLTIRDADKALREETRH
jgi:4'-phosphopantetheinyl transferase